jgi:prevent-host-death family protein
MPKCHDKTLDFVIKDSYYNAKVATRKKDAMIRAGIKDIKNNLSRFLVQVKAGEEVVITERGRPVARIVTENHPDKSIRTALARLAQRGLITLPSRSVGKDHIEAVEVLGKPVSEMVIEDRR